MQEEIENLKGIIEDLKENNKSLEALVSKRYKQIQILEEEINEAMHFKMKTKESRLKLADSLEKYLKKIENIIEN